MPLQFLLNISCSEFAIVSSRRVGVVVYLAIIASDLHLKKKKSQYFGVSLFKFQGKFVVKELNEI